MGFFCSSVGGAGLDEGAGPRAKRAKPWSSSSSSSPSSPDEEEEDLGVAASPGKSWPPVDTWLEAASARGMTTTTATGATAAHAAALEGRTSALEALISAGADVDVSTRNGSTPTFFAAKRGHAAALVRLVKAGADVNKSTVDGATPALAAAARGHVEALDILIGAGADVQRRLHVVSPVWAAVHQGRATTLRRLIRAGCELDGPAPNARAPLADVAIRRGHTDILRVLLSAGYDADQADATGATACLTAAHLGKAVDLGVLISHGANVEKADGKGQTPLIAAARAGHALCVHALVFRAACAVDRAPPNVDRALLIATHNGHLTTVRYLLRAGAVLVADEELGEHGWAPQVRTMSPEIRCIFELAKATVPSARLRYELVFSYLQAVRQAGGWRAYCTEQRRTLAVLLALLRRRRRRTTTTTTTTTRKPDNGPPAKQAKRQQPPSAFVAPHPAKHPDMALFDSILTLPDDIAASILGFYSELHL